MGSSPGDRPALDSFIKSTLGGGGMLKSVMTFGYVKATFRRFFATYRVFLLRINVAEVGKKAPDAKILTLNGVEKNLINDYIDKTPNGMPLILNMGSYT